MSTQLPKDKRTPKQFGDFAEHYVMYLLGNVKRMSVAHVDHVGADVIATDGNGLVYAISVKGRIFPSGESKGYVFDAHNIQMLHSFSDTYNKMIPAVAFVCVDDMEGKTKLRTFIIRLDTMEELANEDKKPVKYLTRSKYGGISFNYQNSTRYQHLEEIKNNPKINYTEMVFTEFTDTLNI